MIAAEQLVYRYPRSARPLWNGLCFDLDGARMALLLGPSGSGKSTLARLLCSLLPAVHGGTVEGRLFVAGRTVGRCPDGRVGMLSQNVEAMLHSPRVGEELAERARVAGSSEALAEAVELLEIGSLLDRPIHELSGGQKQRVALAAALAGGAELLVLDEPTSNLDAAGTAAMPELLGRICRRGRTALLAIEHRPQALMPLADGAIRLDVAEPVRQWRGRSGHVPADVLPTGLDLKGLRQHAEASRRAAPPARPLLECRGLTCRRAGNVVLRDVRLQITTGQIVGLYGPNGAGKTTLLEALIGQVRCERGGAITWRGQPARRCRVPLRHVGMLMQNPLHQLFCQTVRSEVAMAAENARLDGIDERVDALLAAADLTDVAERSSLALCFGQQQRTALAAALSHEPDLVLLDEPTHGMDDVHLHALVQLILARRAQGTSFLIASHDRALLEACCDRILLLERGELREDGSAAA